MQKNKKITIHNIIWYILIFSVLGLLIETIYGYITTGIIESRKGLILGPFCPIYGIGAEVIILCLDSFKDSKIKLFLMCAIVGTIFEYVCSYVLQVIYGSRFWDYSYTTLQINGRISLSYTFFWGILAVILMCFIKPKLDKFIEKIPSKFWDKAIIIFLVVDMFITIIGISIFMNRVSKKYNNINCEKSVLDFIFNDKLMISTFPNLRYMNSNGEEIFVKDIIKK